MQNELDCVLFNMNAVLSTAVEQLNAFERDDTNLSVLETAARPT